MPDLPTAQAETAIAAMLTAGATYYLALATTAPSASAFGTEVTGGSYARQPITFSESNGVATSTNAQSFTNMPAEGGSLYIGLFTAATGGTYLWGAATAAVTGGVTAGATVQFAAGAVTAAVS